MIFGSKIWIIHDMYYVHLLEYMNYEYLIQLRGKCILDMETWIRYTWYEYMDFIYVTECDLYMWIYIYMLEIE